MIVSCARCLCSSGFAGPFLTWRFASQEAKRFDGIDQAFHKIMSETAKNPIALEACSVPGRLQMLQDLSDSLEACQKSLSQYLDSKRCVFPRFYFISDVRALMPRAGLDSAGHKP